MGSALVDLSNMPDPKASGSSALEDLANSPTSNGTTPTDVGQQPASLKGVFQTLTTKEGLQAAADPLTGFVKGVGDTVHGTGELIRKGMNMVHSGMGDKVVPPTGQAALEKYSESSNNTQIVGKAMEGVGEFLTGEGAVDEAGKALSLGEKAKKFADVATFMEKHPFIAKMIVGGGKAGLTTAGVETVKSGSPAQGAEAGAVAVPLGAVGTAAGQGVKYIRDLYKPLLDVTEGTTDTAAGTVDPRTGTHSPLPGPKNPQIVQPVFQKGIRDTLEDVADQNGVKASSSQSIRDVVADTAEGVKGKSQPIFQAVDEASGGKFSDAQAAAKKYSGAIDKAGKDAFEDALKKQDDIFQKFIDGKIKGNNGRFSAEDLDKAKADWKQYRALQQVDDAVKSSTVGQRPEVAKGTGQPAESVNPKQLLNKFNQLYNDNTLQTAVGNDAAHQLLQHAGSAQTTMEDIAYQNRQMVAANRARNQAIVEANRAKNASTVAANTAANQKVIEANKAANETKQAGRRIVSTVGAIGATAGITAAVQHGAYKAIKEALSGQ